MGLVVVFVPRVHERDGALLCFVPCPRRTLVKRKGQGERKELSMDWFGR